MNTAKVCSGCGKAVPADALQGICPEYLIKAGFETRTAYEAARGKANCRRQARHTIVTYPASTLTFTRS